MKAYKPTRKLVDSLLDGNPLGNIFLVSALQRYADEVIKYEASLDMTDKDTVIRSVEVVGASIISPQALARTAEEVIELMNTHFK